jgi:peptidoglycan/xylan/chitin deacetylase (PgdA/CDA1 family)
MIMLQIIRNLRSGFAVAIILITILTNAAIAMSHTAYSQSSSSIPNTDSINAANNKAVILNFDDAYKSQYTNAKPILDKYGYKATFYLICNDIESNGYLSWEDIAALYNDGNDIGSHTMNHVDLSKTSKRDSI